MVNEVIASDDSGEEISIAHTVDGRIFEEQIHLAKESQGGFDVAGFGSAMSVVFEVYIQVAGQIFGPDGAVGCASYVSGVREAVSEADHPGKWCSFEERAKKTKTRNQGETPDDGGQ